MNGGPADAPHGLLDRVYGWINGGFDRMDASAAAAAARACRRHWEFAIGGRKHTLEARCKSTIWDSGERIYVDGEFATYLEPPRPGAPRIEGAWTIDGHSIVVATEYRYLWEEHLRIDVFVDGLSLYDRRTLGETRAAAPDSFGRYDFHLSAWQTIEVTRYPRTFGTAVALALQAASVVPLFVLVFVGAVWRLLVPTVVAIAACFLIPVLVNRYNLRRPQLGAVRWLTFLAALFMPAPISIAILYVLHRVIHG